MTLEEMLGLPGYVVGATATEDEVAGHTLHPAELESLGATARQARVDTFTMGRIAAHRALCDLTGRDGPIIRSDSGAPVWPDGIVGSISHAAGRALALVARRSHCNRLGVDLEEVVEFENFPDHVAFDIELERLDTLVPEERHLAAFELFSAKESIFKAFHPAIGCHFGYEAARVMPAGEGGLEGWFTVGLVGGHPVGDPFPILSAWSGDLISTAVIIPSSTDE